MARFNGVWIVTSGVYSGYRIEAVFPSRAEAAKFVAALVGTERQEASRQIERWEFGKQPKMSRIFRCELDAASGKLRSEWSYTQWNFDANFVDRVPSASAGKAGAFGTSDKSAEHARKLAAEARQKWLRERAQGAISPSEPRS